MVERIVEGLDYSKFDMKYAGRGRPAYHPSVLLKVLLMGYMDSIRSSRRLAKNANESFVYVYLAERLSPDFRTICRFRAENPDIVQQVFSDICQFALEHKFLDLSHLLSDGSTIKANANKDVCINEKILKKIERNIDRWIKEGIKIDEEEDKIYGDRGYHELPGELCDPEKRNEIAKKIADEVNKSMKKDHDKKKLEEIKKIQDKHSVLKNFLGDQKKMSFTDPDSRIMKNKKGNTEFCYNVQSVVDNKHQLIVGNSVTQDAHDRFSIEPNVKLVEEEFGLLPPGTKISFDAGCQKGTAIINLDKKGFDIYTPPYGSQKKNPFAKINFEYDEQQDVYICPENKTLRNVGMTFNKKRNSTDIIYKAELSDCRTCPKWGMCAKNSKARRIQALPSDKIMNRIKMKMQTEMGKDIYRNRKKVEKAFGDIKENKGFRQFMLRGLEKVKTEWTLVCAVYNLRIIHNLLMTRKNELSKTIQHLAI